MTHASSCQSVSGWGRSTNEVIAAPSPPHRLLSSASTFPPCTFLEVRAAKSRFASSELDCSVAALQMRPSRAHQPMYKSSCNYVCVIVGLFPEIPVRFIVWFSVCSLLVHLWWWCHTFTLVLSNKNQNSWGITNPPPPHPHPLLNHSCHLAFTSSYCYTQTVSLLTDGASFNHTTSVWALRNRRTHSFISPIDRVDNQAH